MDNTLISHLNEQTESQDLDCLDTDKNSHAYVEERSKLLAVPAAKRNDEEILPLNNKEGLFNIRAIFFLLLWYFFSGCTLFLNKYILSYMKGDPAILGTSQMLMTTICGFVQMYFPCGMYKPTQRLMRPPGFYRHMVLVGCTRFITVILGLVALDYVAVSFTETIKSSAPLFTVLISRCLLGEATGLYVSLSLIPVMSGLALCSANELSFDTRGFLAAMATNLTECLQNVYSKMLISGDKFKYTPAELQFYTSIASVVIQIPVSIFLVDISGVQKTMDAALFSAFVLNGIFFHFQSITAYVLMDYISPVTHSVANTAKRAFLIWLSVLLFGNPVTLLSGLGTCTVIVGVLLYNKAQEYDRLKMSKDECYEPPITFKCNSALPTRFPPLVTFFRNSPRAFSNFRKPSPSIAYGIAHAKQETKRNVTAYPVHSVAQRILGNVAEGFLIVCEHETCPVNDLRKKCTDGPYLKNYHRTKMSIQ